MKKSDIVYLIVATAMVSACGGGGSGGGGGGVAPIPAPPPAPPPPPPPPPPPTTANADLLNLTQSENFTNNAVTGIGDYPKSGANGATDASTVALTVIYDAANRSYTISNPSRSQSFAPATRDTTLSNAQQDVFKVVNGNVTDTLTLSKPGTSGALTYQYVGSGFWQRTTDSATAISAFIDAFTYGVETTDAAMRRTGAARFDVDLLGTTAYSDLPARLQGSGTLEADFETFLITTLIPTTEFFPTGSSNLGPAFQGTATISSSLNGFSGQFNMGSFQNGAWSGRFYGPNTREVGATFSARANGGAIATLGTITGRYAADIASKATNKSLVNLSKDTFFVNSGAFVGYNRKDGTNELAQYPGNGGGANGNANVSFSYKADTQTYSYGPEPLIFSGGPGGQSYSFGPGQLSAALSDAKFTTYQVVNSGQTSTLKLYKPAGSNSELQLSYTGFGHFTNIGTASGGNQAAFERFFIYRLPDNAGGAVGVPRTGSANFGAKIYGIATEGAGTFAHSLSGDANFAFNFANQSFTGSMTPLGTNRDTGATRNWGSFNYSGNIFGFTNQFDGRIVQGTTDVGSLFGWLLGPAADEVGANFVIGPLNVGQIGNQWSLRGVLIGKKCPTATPC